MALVDTPSDKVQGIADLFRLSRESFTDTQAVVATFRQRFLGSKIVLVGTNPGTVPVGNAQQRDPRLAAAFVLTSPVTVSHRGDETLVSLDVDGTKYRVLVASNQRDGCVSSPAYAGRHLPERNHFDFAQVDPADDSGNRQTECGGNSPHGFPSIEKECLAT